MPTSCRPYEPDQVMLLPAAPQVWLPAGHLAHIINDTVQTLELRASDARYEGGGSSHQPVHPAMVVMALVFDYATGVFGSHEIERRETHLAATQGAREHHEQRQREWGSGAWPQ